MPTLRNISDLLLPVPEAELKPLLTRFQEQLCAFFRVPASLLYIADSMDATHFRYEAAAGFPQEPSPTEFRTGEGFLGQAVKEKRPLQQPIPDVLVGDSLLSTLVESEGVNLLAIPLTYQGQVEALWVLASNNPDLLESLQAPKTQELFYQAAVYLQSVRARRSIQALLEQSQLQNQELISREEELRQNLEELSVTQEEMRRTQKLYEERAHWQSVYVELVNTLQNIATAAELHPLAQEFVQRLGQQVEAQAIAVWAFTPQGLEQIAYWGASGGVSPFPTGWTLPEKVLEALQQPGILPLTASELALTPPPESWLAIPGFRSEELLGFFLIGGLSVASLAADTLRKFLQDITQALFNAYRRTAYINTIAKEFYKVMAQASQAELTIAPRSSLETGQLPWLESIPEGNRADYISELRQAAAEGRIYCIFSMQTDAKEMVTITVDQLFRFVWA